VVIVSYFNTLRAQGHEAANAAIQGSLVRFRTVLMTALLAMLGLLPMALSHGIGSEVQKPLAVVIIGGLISATFLTLVVLPALYTLLERGRRTLEPPFEAIHAPAVAGSLRPGLGSEDARELPSMGALFSALFRTRSKRERGCSHSCRRARGRGLLIDLEDDYGIGVLVAASRKWPVGSSSKARGSFPPVGKWPAGVSLPAASMANTAIESGPRSDAYRNLPLGCT